MWWKRAPSAPVDFKLLANGNVGWFSSWNGSRHESNEFQFDGAFRRATITVGTPTDLHNDEVGEWGSPLCLLSSRLRDTSMCAPIPSCAADVFEAANRA